MQYNHTIDYRKENSDVVYFSASIKNEGDQAQVLDFKQSRPQTILTKANDYYLAVVRFSIPHKSIAIFNFRQNDYFVTINEAGVDKTTQLIYEDRGNPFANLSPTFQGIYYFQQFLDSINTALATSHAAAPASPGNPPQIIRDAASGIFSLIVDTTYTSDIFFNYKLYEFFVGMTSNFISFTAVKGVELIYRQVFDNVFTYPAPLVGSYFKMVQENKSDFIWSNIKYIVITTNSIPCKKEYLGATNLSLTSETQNVTDFIPIQDEYTSYDRSDWVYNAGSGYRLIDLDADTSLRKIDFKVYLVNRDNFFFPLSIAPGDTVDCKFMFIKRALFNNEYNGLVDYKSNNKSNISGIPHVQKYGPR